MQYVEEQEESDYEEMDEDDEGVEQEEHVSVPARLVLELVKIIVEIVRSIT